ncbi:MAG: aspartate--tRNA ligase [Patescibacteria group bacterium]
MFRTHTCGELNKENAGQKVTLSGWVNKMRNFGGLIFVDLRDRYGITQIKIEPEQAELVELAKEIGNEYVVKVEGTVGTRPGKEGNKNMATGEIEVVAEKMEILSQAKVPPFEIFATDKEEPAEELRLKYRFLDLRREKMQYNIAFRAKVIRMIRDFMDEREYIHIETPILTSSSPEGARDFLVPSRLHPGKFYALPQAPQQFKQLLMVAGFDKYYQIAACMRDEDPRADRSPGEFYQLDAETSFKTSKEFQDEMEPMFIQLTEKMAGKKVKEKPFPRIPYIEALDKYGSDKPDLRYEMALIDLTHWAKETDFKVFNSADCVKALVVDGADKLSRKDIDTDLGELAKKMGAKGLAWLKYNDGKYDGGIAKFFNEKQLTELAEKLKLTNNQLILFVADEYSVVIESLGKVRNRVAEKMNLIDPDLIAWAWIVDFPMYEKNKQTGKIDFSHNPFSMPQGGMKSLEKLDPLKIVADQYDVVANGFEMASGAVRNYNPDILHKVFKIVGYGPEVVKKKFGGMLNAFSYGAPPHCGFAFGIERMTAILLGLNQIKDVVAFPKNNQAQDLLMNAPSEVSDEQLKELGIEIRKK